MKTRPAGSRPTRHFTPTTRAHPPTTLKHNFLCSWPQDHRPRAYANLALITPTKPDNSISGTAKQLLAEATLLYFTLLGGMKDGHAEKVNVYKL